MIASLIKQIIGYKQVPISQIAREAGKTPANLYQILERDDLRESLIQQLAEILDCDYRVTFIDRNTGRIFTEEDIAGRKEKRHGEKEKL